MRIVKLSMDEFATERDFDDYLHTEIPQRTPPGLFVCGHQIAEDGLDVDEPLVFSLKGHICFVARSASGRMDNSYLKIND